MRATITRRNEFGGNDFFYRIQCDDCGSFLMMPKKRNKPQEIMEFRTCGEETLCAIARGWIICGETAICDKCIKSISSD